MHLLIEKYKNIIVWGAGNRGKQIVEQLYFEGVKSIIVVDENQKKQGTYIYKNIYVHSPEYILNIPKREQMDYLLIISPFMYKEEIMSRITSVEYIGTVWSNYDFHNIVEIPSLITRVESEKYKIDFDLQLQDWFNNILSEVDFWKNCVAKPDSKYHNVWLERQIDKEFICERLARNPRLGELVMDIGSGICSKYGSKIQSSSEYLNFVAVDPLAFFYNHINKKYGCDTEIRFGMFEILSYQFPMDSADYILIDNAIDHCIDPLAAIIESYKILKIGGVLSLSHNENEAFFEKYYGLHKWNVAAYKNEMIFWNDNQYVNVSRLLSQYCDIDLQIKDFSVANEVPFGRVICNITKRREIPNHVYPMSENRVIKILTECMNTLSEPSFAERYLNLWLK